MTDLSPNVAFENASQAYSLETQRLTALAQAQKTAMETASIEQKVIEQQLSNVRLGLSINEYRIALNRFHAQRIAREHEAERIARHAKNLARYVEGHRAAGIVRQWIWSGYKALLPLIPESVIARWAGVEISTFTWGPANWVAVSVGGVPQDILRLLPESMPNVATLIDWQLEKHEFAVAKFASYAHLATMAAFKELGNAWAAEVARLQGEIAAIEKGTFEIWKPQDVMKIIAPAAG